MEKEGISVQNQKLIFKGKHMEDSHTLDQYKIKPNSNISVHIKNSSNDSFGQTKGEISVCVETLKGYYIKFNAKLTDTIRSFKEKIFGLDKIPIEKQYLIYNGQIMKDSLAFKDLNLERIDRNKIFLVTDLNEQFPIKVIANYKIFEINVSFTETFSKLKEKIYQKEGYPIKDQKFYMDCLKKVEDTRLIGEYLYPNQKIFLMLKSYPSPPGEFPITIRNLVGKYVDYNICSNETVLNLKFKVNMKEGIPPDHMRLIFDNNILEDDKTLGDYKIVSGSKIFLTLKLKGGKLPIPIFENFPTGQVVNQ